MITILVRSAFVPFVAFFFSFFFFPEAFLGELVLCTDHLGLTDVVVGGLPFYSA